MYRLIAVDAEWTLVFRDGVEHLRKIEAEWTELAREAGSPFLTVEWLTEWWRAFGRGQLRLALLMDADDALRAGAALSLRGGRLVAPANDHSGDWDIVATDARARARLWEALARTGSRELVLRCLHDRTGTAGLATAAFQANGYRIVREPGPISPCVPLDESFDVLLRSRSKNLRSKLKRSKRLLEQQGQIGLRTVTEPAAVERDLEHFLRLEASGWKGANGTAILSAPHTAELYRSFGARAAQRAWMRLHLLELDGVAVAGAYSIAFGAGESLLKSAFDERLARCSPGLLLREHLLRSAFEEGHTYYDFLGAPTEHKLRWTDTLVPRVSLRAYRGGLAMPSFAYRRSLRPALKTLRNRWRESDRRGAAAR